MTKKPKSSAMTSAERQAAYRARKAEEGGGRLSTMVHPTVLAGLRRLAAHHGESQADVLLRLVRDAESEALDSLKSDKAATKKYYADGEA